MKDFDIATWRAIAAYAESYGLKVELADLDAFRFSDKSGKIIKVGKITLANWYKKDCERQKQAKPRTNS
jgi:hypothetical protein